MNRSVGNYDQVSWMYSGVGMNPLGSGKLNEY